MAGPTIIPTLPRSVPRAATAGSSSLSTSRGVIASSEGRCRPLSADIQPAARKSGHTCGWGRTALRVSRPQPTASPTSVASTMRRRSIQSASAPPMKAVASSGTSSATPSSPTANEDSVSR